MTKESILYDGLGIYSFTLRTFTIRTGDKNVVTSYFVKWLCEYGPQDNIEQEISKEEYEYLLKELNNGNA